MAIHFDDYVIYTPVDQVVEVLKISLFERGIYRFSVIKQTNDNVMTNCPFHADGQERKPSFGISSKGECHCFACGYATKSFPVFVSDLFGYADNGAFGKKWLLSQILSSPEEQPRMFSLDFTNRYNNKANHKDIISEEELDSYRYIHPYMYQRHLNDDIINRFDVGYDKSRQCLTFPVKDLEGDVVFVATRSVLSKFFTLPESQSKPIYGAYLFRTGKYKKAVICESILNALTCWKFNIPAMALMGTGSYSQIEVLSRLPVCEYYLALDPDNAGNLGCSRILNSLKGRHILYRYNLPPGKDINDLDSEFLSIKPELFLGNVQRR